MLPVFTIDLRCKLVPASPIATKSDKRLQPTAVRVWVQLSEREAAGEFLAEPARSRTVAYESASEIPVHEE